MAVDKSVLDFPEITTVDDADVVYALHGVGVDRDKKATKGNFLKEVVAANTDLAGVGRTTETVKGNADDIGTVDGRVDSLAGAGHTTETVKQNADDIAGLSVVPLWSRAMYRRAVNASFKTPSYEQDMSEFDIDTVQLVWQNNISNYANSLYPDGHGGQRAMEGGGWWLFGLASGIIKYNPANAYTTVRYNLTGSVATDFLRGARFSDDGQYGVVYSYKTPNSYVTVSTSYGQFWSGPTLLNDGTKRCAINQLQYNNGYFYFIESTTNSLYYALETAPANVYEVTNSNGVFNEGTNRQRLLTANGELFITSINPAGGTSVRVYKMTDDTTLDPTPIIGTLTGGATAQYQSDSIQYRASGNYEGYNFMFGSGNYFAILVLNLAKTTLTQTTPNIGKSIGYGGFDDADVGYVINHTDMVITDKAGNTNGKDGYATRIAKADNTRVHYNSSADKYMIGFSKDTDGNTNMVSMCVLMADGTQKFFQNDALMNLRDGDISVPALV